MVSLLSAARSLFRRYDNEFRGVTEFMTPVATKSRPFHKGMALLAEMEAGRL